MPAPLPEDDATRLAALHEYQVLDTEPEDVYDDITRLAAHICGTPIAIISLIDKDRQWFKSAQGLDVRQTPREDAFCAHTILTPHVVVVPDATLDPRFHGNPLTTGDPGIRFYAGAPLITEDGHALGSLCVLDRVPRTLTDAQEEALRVLAHQVTTQLELRRRVEAQARLIAERDQAEELRRASEETLRQIGAAVASATEGITIADARLPDMPITYANPAFLALTGYGEGEVIGRNCRFLQGAGTDPDARREMRQAIDAGRACRVTLRNYRKDGSPFWNELTIAPVPDAEGALTHFVGVQHDVTALREADEALRRSEAKFRNMIDLSPVPFCLNDERQNVTLLNAKFVATFGYTQGDIPTLADWWPRAYPDPEYRRWVTSSWQARLEEAAQGGAPFEPLEVNIQCKDGTTRTVIADAAALEPSFGGQHLVVLNDITMRRRQEEALHRNEARLIEAQRVARVGSWEYDFGSEKITWSAEMFRLFGQDPAEGEPEYAANLALYRSDDAAQLDALVRQAVAAGQDYELDLRRAPQDGRPTQWFHAVGNVVRDAAGRVIRLMGTLQDITERRQAEEFVRRSEARLVEAQRISGIGDWELDVAARRFTWSDEVFRLMEFDRADGEPDYDAVRARYQPDDLVERDRQFARALETGEPYQCDLRLRLPSGTPRWCHLVGRPVLDATGRVVRMVGTAQDVTERRQEAEEKSRLADYNRLLLESTAEGIYGLDMEGRCTFINEAGTRLLGYSWEEMRGRNVHALIHHSRNDGSPYPVEECPIYCAFQEGTPCRVETEVLWRRDGTPFSAEYSSFPLRGGAGLIGAVVTFSDITERVQAEQRVRDSNTVLAVQKVQLEAANAELEALATTDPLTGVLNHRSFHQRLEAAALQVAREGATFAVAILDLDGFRFFNDVYGITVGDSVLRRVADRLSAACGPGDTVAHFSGDEFSLLLPTAAGVSPADVEARLQAALAGLSYQPSDAATTIPITASVGVALFPQDGADRHGVVQRAEERLRLAKTGGAGEADAVRATLLGTVEGFSMLDALVTAVDNKDRYTRRHSEDVMEYSLQIAHALGLDEAQRRTVAVAALLHDVGKIGVPDHVLRKPGKLTDAEFGAIQQHPMMGAIIVQAVPGLEETLDAVRHHHERWDGGGYPFGLRGEETPLLARLMAVADAHSAMTTDRPYRKGMDRAQALFILEAGAGTQWDPECVRAFLRAQELGMTGV